MKNALVSLVIIIAIIGCVSIQNLKVDSTPGSKMSQPLDVIGDVQVTDNEIIIKMTTKIRDYPIPYNGSVKNITGSIVLPEQLEIIEGKPGFIGLDLTGNQIIEITITAKAVKNGEGMVELKAMSYGSDIYNTFGETERFFILVTDAENGKIRISNKSFTSYGTEQGSQPIP